jgi:hypothetical protein
MSFGSMRGTGALAAVAPIIIDHFIQSGQSNDQHTGRGPVGSLSAVPYAWDTFGDTNSGGGYVNLVGKTGSSGGPDLSLGQTLYAAGINAEITNVCAGSSSYDDWLIGHQYGDYAFAALVAFMRLSFAKHGTVWPANTLHRFHHCRDQGTTDQRVNSLPYQQLWASRANSWHARVQAAVDLVWGPGHPVDKLVVQQYTGLTLSGAGTGNCPFSNSAAHTSEIATQNLAYVGGDTSRLVQMEEASVGGVPYYDPDGVHRTDTGYVICGQRQAAAWLPILESQPAYPVSVPVLTGAARPRFTKQQIMRLLARKR